MTIINRGWQTCVLMGALGGIGLVGCEGPMGPAGEVGPEGPPGNDQPPAEDGDDGATGRDGEDGADGLSGADGLDGIDGVDGNIGPAGRDGEDGEDGHAPMLRLLDGDLDGWYGGNRDRLNQLVTDYGASSVGFDPTNRPVAVFDWDNTVMKNDIGDATFFWLIANDKILQPAGYDWGQTNLHMTSDARAALSAACDALAAPSAPLPTSSNAPCADEIYEVYVNARTVAHLPAWDVSITSTINQSYAWVAQLLAGYRPDEVRDFAEAALYENLYAPQDDPQIIGSHLDVTHWVRIYDQMLDLIGTLQDNGFDVWVMSASPQYVVEPAAAEVGIARHHVIGIRTLIDDDGLLTARMQGCGEVLDGDDTLITFDRGKRCWINKVIFREPVESQMAPNPDMTRRPVFVAGDSDTDIAMIKDATVLKLAINRNKMQLMCNAYANAGDRWLVQPMFIEPKSQRAQGYDCDGSFGPEGEPIVDENGNPIADQVDSIF